MARMLDIFGNVKTNRWPAGGGWWCLDQNKKLTQWYPLSFIKSLNSAETILSKMWQLRHALGLNYLIAKIARLLPPPLLAQFSRTPGGPLIMVTI